MCWAQHTTLPMAWGEWGINLTVWCHICIYGLPLLSCYDESTAVTLLLQQLKHYVSGVLHNFNDAGKTCNIPRTYIWRAYCSKQQKKVLFFLAHLGSSKHKQVLLKNNKQVHAWPKWQKESRSDDMTHCLLGFKGYQANEKKNRPLFCHG